MKFVEGQIIKNSKELGKELNKNFDDNKKIIHKGIGTQRDAVKISLLDLEHLTVIVVLIIIADSAFIVNLFFQSAGMIILCRRYNGVLLVVFSLVCSLRSMPENVACNSGFLTACISGHYTFGYIVFFVYLFKQRRTGNAYG